MAIIVLDLDDFMDECTCEKELLALHSYFDDFKITMFTVPLKTSIATMDKMRELGCDYQAHGFEHTFLEMDELVYGDAMEKIKRYVNPLRDLGYFGSVFKAPYWRYSSDAYVALADNDYVIAVSREQIGCPGDIFEIYEYDFELDEEWYKSDREVIRLHGHCTPYRNDLSTWYEDLIKRLPKNTKFLTVEEYMSLEK